MQSIFNEYKDVSKGFINNIKHIINPLNDITQETPIVVIEELLLKMTKTLMGIMGHNVKIDVANEDDLIGEQQDLFNIFRMYPTSDYNLLMDIKKGAAKTSTLRNLRKTFDDDLMAEFKASMENQSDATNQSFQNFAEDKIRTLFNNLWDESFEKLVSKDLVLQSYKDRHKARNLKEKIVKKFVESKITLL